MSEGQEAYHDAHSPGGQQQPDQQQDSTTGGPSTASPKQSTSHKRKRESVDAEGKEEGRSEGTTSRRTSFKQTSPNMPAAFIPINPNSPQQTSSQYAYQPLNVSQSQTSINGSSSQQDAANAALAANAMSTLLPQLQNSDMSFASTESQAKPGEHVQMDPQYQMVQQALQGHNEAVAASHSQKPVATPQRSVPPPPAPASNPKPQVGTEEWHRVRRDNHKEVERRRRETINEGINELAKIVPGCEKNKGSILQRAVQYITQLKENEASNIEKWTLEKLLTEQAIQELSASNEKLKKECERAWREAETWKQSCLQAGVTREGGGQSGSS